MNRLVDRVFGELTYDVCWERQVNSPLLGNNVALLVQSPAGEPPGEGQRTAYQAFLAAQEDLRVSITEAIFKYCESIKERYRRFEPDSAPDLNDPNEVWQLLSNPSIYLPVQEVDDLLVDLTWACRWEEEHGLELKLRGLHIDYVGPVT